MIKHGETKAEFNARAKASMREYLLSKTWEEKVASLERMKVAKEIAQQGMREALAKLSMKQ